MPNLITVKIDVTMIDKALLFKGSKKNAKDVLPQYLDLVLMPKAQQSNFGDWRDEQTHMVVQSISKEARARGEKGPILGNACERIGDRDRRSPAAKQPEPVAGDEPPESDDAPF